MGPLPSPAQRAAEVTRRVRERGTGPDALQVHLEDVLRRTEVEMVGRCVDLVGAEVDRLAALADAAAERADRARLRHMSEGALAARDFLLGFARCRAVRDGRAAP